MSDVEDNEAGLARVSSFARNDAGRDFVVGDIHGMFGALEALLSEIEFDEQHDRMFSVGDLVDRGPDSNLALHWLAKPWFFACRGNHEQFVLDSSDPEQYELWVNHNGGEWWLALEPAERERFIDEIAKMPLAMEVTTGQGIVGIVHADVPPLMSWDAFMERLDKGDEDAIFYAMWSRNRIAGAVASLPVRGRIDRVYCGHTPTRETVTVDNVHYIDTGAVYYGEGYLEARLTAVQIHPEPHLVYSHYTAPAS
jgi:serine/threonine protein phosphatase 1